MQTLGDRHGVIYCAVDRRRRYRMHVLNSGPLPTMMVIVVAACASLLAFAAEQGVRSLIEPSCLIEHDIPDRRAELVFVEQRKSLDKHLWLGCVGRSSTRCHDHEAGGRRWSGGGRMKVRVMMLMLGLGGVKLQRRLVATL